MSQEADDKFPSAKDLNLSFTDSQAIMAILVALDRMEERQRLQSKVLFKLLEKIAPELADSPDYEFDNGEDWVLKTLLRIQDDVNLVKDLQESQEEANRLRDSNK